MHRSWPQALWIQPSFTTYRTNDFAKLFCASVIYEWNNITYCIGLLWRLSDYVNCAQHNISLYKSEPIIGVCRKNTNNPSWTVVSMNSEDRQSRPVKQYYVCGEALATQGFEELSCKALTGVSMRTIFDIFKRLLLSMELQKEFIRKYNNQICS